jgi:hypothetical protein
MVVWFTVGREVLKNKHVGSARALSPSLNAFVFFVHCQRALAWWRPPHR